MPDNEVEDKTESPKHHNKEEKYYESMIKAEQALILYQYLKRLERMGVDVSKVHIPKNNITKNELICL